MFLLRGGARLAKHKPAPVPSETDRLLFGRAILFSGRAVLSVLCSEQCSGSSGRAVLCRALLWLLSVSSAHSGLISEVEHAALCSEQLPIYHWSKTICGCISTLDFYMCVLCSAIYVVWAICSCSCISTMDFCVCALQYVVWAGRGGDGWRWFQFTAVSQLLGQFLRVEISQGRAKWKLLRAEQSGQWPWTNLSGHLPSVPINSQSLEDGYCWVHFAKVTLAF